jgi:hypothetical protein
MIGAVILLILLIWIAIGCVGAWIATQRRRHPAMGFAFGFFFGPIGLLIVALLPYGSVESQLSSHARGTSTRHTSATRNAGPVPRQIDAQGRSVRAQPVVAPASPPPGASVGPRNCVKCGKVLSEDWRFLNCIDCLMTA